MRSAHLSERRLWRIGALTALTVALLMIPSIALAYLPPTPPITPVFPPWVLPAVSASLPATITGTVTDSVGNPIANVNVEVHGDTSSTAVTAQSFQQRGRTDADGKFVITDVIQGTYQLTVNDPNYTPYSSVYREEYVWHDEIDGTVADTRHNVIGGSTVDVGTVELTLNGRVRGRATDSGAGVEGSAVEAKIIDPVTSIPYWRSTTTDVDGNIYINNAPPGDWQLTYSASGQKVPVDAQQPELGGMTVYADDQPVCVSAPIVFSLASATSKLDANKSFQNGTRVVINAYETAYSSSYNVGNIQFSFAPSADPGDPVHTFSAITADDGWIRFYMPPGTYDVTWSDYVTDPRPLYETETDGGVEFVSGGTVNFATQLTPAADTRAVYGQILESGSADTYVQSWVAASPVAPSSAGWQYPYRRVLSNGTGANAKYLIRVPSPTGYSGNQVKVEFYDKKAIIPDTTMPEGPTHIATSVTVGGTTDALRNISVPVGASISGRVTDETGDPVEGVSVSARRKGIDPSMPFVGLTWLNQVTPNSSPWVTLTDANGEYTLGGLPTDSDYKVTYYPDYNPGWPLDAKYRDYNRFVYNSAPLADQFDAMATPPVHDHDPVSIPSAGFARTGIDTTISPGGYVGIHADGPEYPTGSVYCDVMYQVTDAVTGSGTAWAEVDSGFTTGGTFEKLSKVLPAGTYRLDYSDYFGRGGGSWSFYLAGLDHAYNSVLVPVPLTITSTSLGTASAPMLAPAAVAEGDLSAAFVGQVNGGLVDGGTGGLKIAAGETPMPGLAPPLPTNWIDGGGVYKFSDSGATWDGMWTFTMPYSPSVPDSVVSKLRVRALTGSEAALLTPISVNKSKHQLQVQWYDPTTFDVAFLRAKVTLLSQPYLTTSSPKAYRSFTVYGSLAPQHTAGGHSVQLTLYKYNATKHRWSYYTKTSATNYNYRTYTRYKKSFKLPKGTYRVSAYAPADTWHLATSASKTRTFTVK